MFSFLFLLSDFFFLHLFCLFHFTFFFFLHYLHNNISNVFFFFNFTSVAGGVLIHSLGIICMTMFLFFFSFTGVAEGIFIQSLCDNFSPFRLSPTYAMSVHKTKKGDYGYRWFNSFVVSFFFSWFFKCFTILSYLYFLWTNNQKEQN